MVDTREMEKAALQCDLSLNSSRCKGYVAA